MIIQLPDDEIGKKRIYAYLETHKIPFEEVI